jgi:geranylgeranylglycerol-phosphate geranylgeranyltransferase
MLERSMLTGNKRPRLIEKLRGFFILSRPINVLISFLSIFIAIVICGPLNNWPHTILACLTGAFLTAAANAINDVYDLEIDRINRPYRPLPSGVITPKGAIVYSTAFFLLGVLSSAFINMWTLIIALIFSVLLFVYSAKFKRQPVIGNFTVSLATAFAFLYGGIAVGHVENAIFPAIFAFLMHFGREIIKDIEDVEGDRSNNAQTLPIRYGLRAAKKVVTILLVMLIAVTQMPCFLNIYGIWYLVVVNIGVNTVLLFTIFLMWIRPTRSNFRLLSAILKADMLIGLAAIYLGRWS